MENHLKKYEKELEEIEMAVGGGSPVMRELLENYKNLIDTIPGENNIDWVYKGDLKGYEVYLNDEKVYFTKDSRDRDLFIAQLKKS